MSYKLLKKVYQVDCSQIDEGYLYDQKVSYAETRGKAKTELLKEIEGAKIQHTLEDVTYLNIPIERYKRLDLLDFNGKEMTIGEIENHLAEEKREQKLEEILNNESIKYCYIVKSGYYRPNRCGYTDYKHRAGVYTKEEAVLEAKSCGAVRVEVIDIEEHNKRIQDEIQDLKSRIITP